MNLPIQTAFQTALKGPNPLWELRSVAEKLLTAGHQTADLLAELEGLRPHLTEEEEDLLLEVMDFLTGWCSPHLQIEISESGVEWEKVSLPIKPANRWAGESSQVTPVFTHETVLNIPLSLEEANQVREIAGIQGLSVTELLHRWVVEQIHGFQPQLA